jgi:protein TonB
VLLSFTFDREGRVLAHRIARSSGHSSLDREVAAMLERAQPLPPMPDTMTQARLEVTVPVLFALR